MSIEIRNAGEVTIVDIDGKITFDQGASDVRNTVQGLVAEGRNSIVLNLSSVSYVDSIGVESFVASHTTLAKKLIC